MSSCTRETQLKNAGFAEKGNHTRLLSDQLPRGCSDACSTTGDLTSYLRSSSRRPSGGEGTAVDGDAHVHEMNHQLCQPPVEGAWPSPKARMERLVFARALLLLLHLKETKKSHRMAPPFLKPFRVPRLCFYNFSLSLLSPNGELRLVCLGNTQCSWVKRLMSDKSHMISHIPAILKKYK